MKIDKSDEKLSSIVCSVKCCAYNDGNGSCFAKQVEVGPSGASCCSETVCATFKPESEEAQGKIFK